jgi:magnesium chelatase family protein
MEWEEIKEEELFDSPDLKDTLVKTFSSSVNGIDALTVTAEVAIGKGELKYFIVGLPDNAVKESMFRVESAIKFSGYRMPRKRIVINLSPADLRKEGSAYDLTIAAGILAASGQMEKEKMNRYLIMGELSLDGILQCLLPFRHAKKSLKDSFFPNKMHVRLPL